MTVGERIRQLRKQRNMSADDLAIKIGKDRSTIYRYESSEIEDMPTSVLEPLARALYTTPGYLMGWDENKSDVILTDMEIPKYKIPVLGKVVAGMPLEAIENIIGYEEVSERMTNGEYFALQIKGDSMQPRFNEGDVVIVRKQDDIDNGDIAIMLVNGDEATIKKVQKFNNGINLIPSNPAYDVLTYSNDDIINLPVRCLGKVVELRAKF